MWTEAGVPSEPGGAAPIGAQAGRGGGGALPLGPVPRLLLHPKTGACGMAVRTVSQDSGSLPPMYQTPKFPVL